MSDTMWVPSTSSMSTPSQNVLNWDCEKVGRWLDQIGLAFYSDKFIDNNITGDVLVYVKPTDLAEIGVESVGHRLKILKAIYQLKVSQNMKLGPDHYIPPSAKNSAFMDSLMTSGTDQPLLYTSFEIRDQRMQLAESEIRKLINDYSRLREDMLPLYRIAKEYKPLPTPDAPSANSPQSAFSPVNDSQLASPAPSSPPPPPPPQYSHNSASSFMSKKHSKNRLVSVTSTASTASLRSPTTTEWQLGDEPKSSISRSKTLYEKSGGIQTPTSNISGSSPSTTSDPLQSLRVSMDDPCHKVLPVALRKYKINGDPKEYILLVCYDDQERLLGVNEKPLRIFTELQEAGRKPVFMLRHLSAPKTQKKGVVVNGTPGGVL